MKNGFLWLALFSWLLVVACSDKKKKKSLSGEETVTIADLVESFPAMEAPFQFGDTVLTKKQVDSSLISYKVFTQFVRDSFISKTMGKGVKPKIYPLAKMPGEEGTTFLFVNMISAAKKAVLLTVLDKRDSFVTAVPVLVLDGSSATKQSVSADKNNTVTKTVTRKNADESMSQGQEVWDLDKGATSFALVMTDALDETVNELINPIDSFGRKQKYTADYGSGKMNLVSIRDSHRGGYISFFIHFEKEEGACTGELKGEAKMLSANTAEYRVGGDPCVLRFSFSNSSVSLKEEGCGARHGLRCSFDGSYSKRKVKETKNKDKK